MALKFRCTDFSVSLGQRKLEHIDGSSRCTICNHPIENARMALGGDVTGFDLEEMLHENDQIRWNFREKIETPLSLCQSLQCAIRTIKCSHQSLMHH